MNDAPFDNATKTMNSVWRQLTPGERLAWGGSLNQAWFALIANYFRQKYPDWTLLQMQTAYRLARLAWQVQDEPWFPPDFARK